MNATYLAYVFRLQYTSTYPPGHSTARFVSFARDSSVICVHNTCCLEKTFGTFIQSRHIDLTFEIPAHIANLIE